MRKHGSLRNARCLPLTLVPLLLTAACRQEVPEPGAAAPGSAKEASTPTAFQPPPDGKLTPEQAAQANNELTMLLVILMVAGNETTRNATSSTPTKRQRRFLAPSCATTY